MNLDQLVSLLSDPGRAGSINVCADSRQIRPGDIFVAVRGLHADGHDFIPLALQRGASFVVCTTPPAGLPGERIVVVPNSAAALGILCQAAAGFPTRRMTCLAVTGTNGKTTVTYLVRSVLQTAGKKCGLVGTIMNDTGRGAAPSAMTTPDAPAMARLTADMAASGVQYLVMEASSHALSQRRLSGIDFTAAAFTNLTGDHLDYHGSMEEYLEAKILLFSNLSPNSWAVLNKNSPVSSRITPKSPGKLLFYSAVEKADLFAKVSSINDLGTIYDLCYQDSAAQVKTPMVGLHNVSNHLAAAGLCLAAGLDLPTIAAGLSALDCVPGRLQPAASGLPFKVYVDYAHTDDALANVLTALRPLCRRRLILVFGCGGDRDRSKRPRMAAVAASLADSIVVTSDNPRTESADAIIADIVTGFSRDALANVTVEADRRLAICAALGMAEEGDIVLIAGKGHEDYQIIGTTKHYFSDMAVVEEWVKAK